MRQITCFAFLVLVISASAQVLLKFSKSKTQILLARISSTRTVSWADWSYQVQILFLKLKMAANFCWKAIKHTVQKRSLGEIIGMVSGIAGNVPGLTILGPNGGINLPEILSTVLPLLQEIFDGVVRRQDFFSPISNKFLNSGAAKACKCRTGSWRT